MNKHIVLTLTGHDRIGIVENVTKLVLDYGGNVEESRMAHLGGEFAMLMLITVSSENSDNLKNQLEKLSDQGYVVNTCETGQADPEKYAGWLPYEIVVNGADHEGIVHHITHYLAEKGINIETMDTHMVVAPMSGTPLFMMDGVIVVPQSLKHTWQDDLIEVGDELNLDISVAPYTG
jgi:glycine cleavage system transcriptional repressor